MNKIRLLVVDDHNIVRNGLLKLLGAEPDLEVIGEATSGRQGVAAAVSLRPDIVLMDLAMPLLNGMEATRQITSNLPNTKVIVLSAYQDEAHVRQVMSAGALGFVLKQAASSELVEAIHEVHCDRAFFSAEVMRHMKGIYSELKNPTGAGSAIPNDGLTTREAEVLQLIAEGFPNKLIADELTLSVKTIEKHRQSLMNKLGLHGTAELVRHAAKNGIIDAVPFQTVLSGT